MASINTPKEANAYFYHTISSQHGGLFEYILNKLNTSHYNNLRLTEQVLGLSYDFTFDPSLNTVLTNKYSSYLANGKYSVVFGITYTAAVSTIDTVTVPTTYTATVPANGQYVFKTALFKKDKDNTDWKQFAYLIIYVKFKEIVGNFLCTLYWYGDNMEFEAKTEEAKTEEVKTELEEPKKIGYEIYKFYQKNKTTPFAEKLRSLFQILSILKYLQQQGIYVFDFRVPNTVINDTITMVDFDKRTFQFWRREDNTALNRELKISLFNSACFKKRLYHLFKLDDEKNVQRIYKDALAQSSKTSILRKQNYDVTIAVNREFGIWRINIPELLPITEKGNLHAGKLYSYGLTATDLFYSKSNYLIIGDIIISLLFESGPKQFDIGVLLMGSDVFPKYENIGGLIKDRTIVDIISCFGNLNNIFLLKKLIYGNFVPTLLYIEPVFQLLPDITALPDNIQSLVTDFIRSTFFDYITERGVMAPDYERSGNLVLILESSYKFYEELMKLGYNELSVLFGNITSLFHLHRVNIYANIGTSRVVQFTNAHYEQEFNDPSVMADILKYIGEDVVQFCRLNGILPPNGQLTIYDISYKKWVLLSLVEQCMNRWQNRTEENILYPPTNSTLDENYFYYVDPTITEPKPNEKDSTILAAWEETPSIIVQKCTKWEFVSPGEFKETDEYERCKAYPPYISREIQHLNDKPLRQYARYLASLCFNKTLVSEESASIWSVSKVKVLMDTHVEYKSDKSTIRIQEIPEIPQQIPQQTSSIQLGADFKLQTFTKSGKNTWSLNKPGRTDEQWPRAVGQLKPHTTPWERAVGQLKPHPAPWSRANQQIVSHKYLKYKDKYLKLKLLLNL